MTQRLTQVAAIALAFAISSPVLAQDTAATGADAAAATETTSASADTVVATVDGKEITLGHMILVRQSLPPQYAQLPDAILFEGILEQLIQQTALQDSFDGDRPRRVEMALENEERAMMAAEAVSRVLDAAVTDAAIEKAYQDTYGNAEPEMEFKAAHILVETEDEAKAIVEELEGGADFAAVAKEKSTGPSGPNGGDLGWFGKGMMVAPFEEAVVAMEAGDISAPVQTQFGWHVILLSETRMKEAPALDTVRDELQAQVEQEVVKAHIDALVEKANVDKSGAEGVDPAALSNIDILE
ncbi:peptidylprolyl isomerase [Pseudooceanicola nitratireducens]|uniref:peptidylprolyl isomerase n=1 Tax=Pseudooceanicola nitratireducens TaxID=517719 RepID=UPI001C9469F1|nr:peptidylprolyl isomerase [Pseudooceanicola nitratireducens]MBY6164332.1 peptidylprolyl isomerase [Pseudooceanicola nitratireducens]